MKTQQDFKAVQALWIQLTKNILINEWNLMKLLLVRQMDVYCVWFIVGTYFLFNTVVHTLI